MSDKAGRKPNIRKIRLAKKYRSMGIPFRAIAFMIAGGDLKQAYRWAKYPDEMLRKKSGKEPIDTLA